MVTITRVTAKLVAALAGLAVAGVIIYKVIYDYFVGPRKTVEDALKKLIETKIDYYSKTVTAQDGALTANQEKYLEDLNKRIDQYSNTVMAWGGDFASLLQTLVLGAIGIGFTIVALKYGVVPAIKARRYVNDNVTKMSTSAGFEALMRNAVNISIAEAGQINIATAAQTSTDMWATIRLYPAMQSQIALITAQMPTLIGTQLLWAQFMVSALQVQMATNIPALMSAGWLYIIPPLI